MIKFRETKLDGQSESETNTSTTNKKGITVTRRNLICKIDVSHNFDNRNDLLIMKKRITVILNSLIIILLFKSFLKTSVLNPSVLIPNSGFSIVDNKVYFSALIDQGKKIVSLT